MWQNRQNQTFQHKIISHTQNVTLKTKNKHTFYIYTLYIHYIYTKTKNLKYKYKSAKWKQTVRKSRHTHSMYIYTLHIHYVYIIYTLYMHYIYIICIYCQYIIQTSKQKHATNIQIHKQNTEKMKTLFIHYICIIYTLYILY